MTEVFAELNGVALGGAALARLAFAVLVLLTPESLLEQPEKITENDKIPASRVL
jgi:hypothetical protein